LVEGDVLDPASLKAAVKNVDIIFHLAAVAGISTVESDNSGSHREVSGKPNHQLVVTSKFRLTDSFQ